MIVKIWFKCAAMFDPVCPRLVSPCKITWDAKYRDVNLIIERKFKGNELVKRMKGWITVEPDKVIDVVEKFGKFIINEKGELFVKLDKTDNFSLLQKELKENFNNEVFIEQL